MSLLLVIGESGSVFVLRLE